MASVGLNKVVEAIKALIKEKLHIPVPVLPGLQTRRTVTMYDCAQK